MSKSAREARAAKALASLSRPDVELESAADRDGNSVRVGDQLQLGARITVVTRIYQEANADGGYDAPIAEVTNAMISAVVLNQVARAN
jgi:hypothetical protein